MSTHAAKSTRSARMHGFTLIELMIATLLGILLVGSIAALLVSSRKNFREDEQVSRLQDELGFAMTQITADIEMAGFWGVMLDPTIPEFELDASLPLSGDCGIGLATPATTLAQTWRFGVRDAIDFEDGQVREDANPGFNCIVDAADDTDIVAVKRLEGGQTVQLVAGDADSRTGMADNLVYFKTNGNKGSLFLQNSAAPLIPAAPYDPTTFPAPYRYIEYTPSIYYIREYSDDAAEDPKIPSLCRKRMNGTNRPSFQTECIARGIEDLQLEFGIDDDADSVPDFFDEALPADASTIVAVRVTLLARSERREGTYQNAKTYQLTPTYAVTPADNFYRRSLTTTVVLRNPANLRKLK